MVLVNETLARRLWPNGGAVGSSVTIGPNRCDVVGVVRDLQWVSALETPEPIAYLNFWQQDRTQQLVAGFADAHQGVGRRGGHAARDPARDRRDRSRRADRRKRSRSARSSTTQFAAVRAARTMLVVFGGLALVLSTIGLYAALAFAVGQRTREIAVRMALGASRADVGRLVFRRGAAIVAIGAVAGLGACVFAGPLLAHLLYGVSPRDPVGLLTGPSSSAW